MSKFISIIKENPQQQEDPQQPQQEKQLDAKAKKIAQQKVLILRKKAQLAAQGAQDISTSYEPEGELVDEVYRSAAENNKRYDRARKAAARR